MQAGLIPVSAARDRWTLQAQPATWRDCRESRETLAAITGLELRMVAATLSGLVASEEVQRRSSGRLERYELR
jgi:hypothetical protein